ncbi:MAG: hypothetical protein J5830_03580 [Clostridia bacterium]|nr:hypothetical protein [Clostridia bacterium]
MKKTRCFTCFALSVLSLSILCSCMFTYSPISEVKTDVSSIPDEVSIAPPGTLGEPLSQEDVVQDHDEGAQVEVSFTGKYAAAYFYDPDDSDEFIVFISSVPNDKALRCYATVYKPDFNGVKGLISALSDGVFQAEYVRKIIFSIDEAEYCFNSTKMYPEYCNEGEIITDTDTPPFAGEGQEQYYCRLYDAAADVKDITGAKMSEDYLIPLSNGRCATVFGNKVAGENSGKKVKTAEFNYRRLFERYGLNGIFK